MQTEYAIDTQGLTKEYKGTTVLNNLDLKVKKNSIFGFLVMERLRKDNGCY